MRRVCISLGQVECGDCNRIVRYSERYLVNDEAEGNKLHLCLDCAVKKGHAHYKSEKGAAVLTFYEELIEPSKES